MIIKKEDIIKETKERIRTHGYILDTENFYECSTDTIHIKSDKFQDPLKLFILVHEIVHARTARFLNGLDVDIQEQENLANAVALEVLQDMGIKFSPRHKRIFAKLLNR